MEVAERRRCSAIRPRSRIGTAPGAASREPPSVRHGGRWAPGGLEADDQPPAAGTPMTARTLSLADGERTYELRLESAAGPDTVLITGTRRDASGATSTLVPFTARIASGNGAVWIQAGEIGRAHV